MPAGWLSESGNGGQKQSENNDGAGASHDASEGDTEGLFEQREKIVATHWCGVTNAFLFQNWN
jgi:hypothetical protein